MLAAKLPADAVYRQVAIKALEGRFGPLEPWQRQGYKKLLTVTPTRKLAWITNYSHTDPGCNRTTASGRKVSRRVAAMLDVAFGTYVLLDLPQGFELAAARGRGVVRQVFAL